MQVSFDAILIYKLSRLPKRNNKIQDEGQPV